MKRGTLAFLFLALVALALARWVVDGARWVVAPRRRGVSLRPITRAATAK